MCKCLLELIFGVLFSTLCSGYVLSYSNCRDCLRFPLNGTTVLRVERILIDAVNNRLLAGATNSLFRLQLTNFQLPSVQNDFLALPPSQAALQPCLNGGFSQDNCQNNIKTLLLDNNGHIFACGTFARETRCWRFQRTSALSPISEGVSGYGITPSSYNQNVTSTLTSDHLFTGINLGLGTSRSIIYRTAADGNSNNALISVQDNEMVLKDANFVSSFEYKDNFVYFFLREAAVEKGKGIIYARVARVCKYDEGADRYALKGSFTSFVKTRILCSVPGEIPFDYDQIQAAVKSTDPETNEDFVYAIFTTPELGVTGSAVCRYSMKSVVELFDKSQYLERTDIKGYDGIEIWKAVSPTNLTSVPGRPKCDRSLDTKSYPLATNSFAYRHTLLADPLQSNPAKPLFTKAEIRFTGLVVDEVKGEYGAVVPVMFVSTDNGTVFKVFNNLSGGHSPIVVEQINIFEEADPIYTMQLYKGFMYIGSKSSVVKLPVERCSQYQTCRICVSSLDPYCGWSINKCTTFKKKEGSNWAQDISHGNFTKVCPQELPTCSLTISKKTVGGTTSLLCQGERGIPLPQITKWTKDSKALTGDNEYQIKPGKTQYQGRLEIHNFGINHLGVYECVVSNKLGSSSCAMNVSGTLPVITSTLVRINRTTLFVCNATGLPVPGVAIYKIVGDTKHVIYSHQVPISTDTGHRSYYCVAQNQFGLTFGKTFNLYDKRVKAELRVTSEEWSSDLSDIKSNKYKTLAAEVRTAVTEAYAKNPAFVALDEIVFRKGSVICKLTLLFAADPLNTNDELLADLQIQVSTGKVGLFTVDKSHPVSVEPNVELTTNRPVFSTVQVVSGSTFTTPQIQEPTPAPDVQESVDSGLFAVAVVTAIMLSLILGFLLGVKFHRLVLSHCKRSSGDPDSCDGAKNETVEGVRYIKSPPRDERLTRNKNEAQSRKNLLKKKRDGTVEQKEDSDSDTSAAGKIGEEDRTPSNSPAKSISPSVSITKFEKNKPTLNNGRIVDVC